MKTLVRAILAKRSKELNISSLQGEHGVFFFLEPGSLALITFNLKLNQWMERKSFQRALQFAA